MKILVRLPNWLGDIVMSVGFLEKLNQDFPESMIDVIVKKGLDEILIPIKGINKIYTFSKAEYKGLSGVWRFGKEIAAQQKYDVFFCLPDSFSSALMGYATSSKLRIGYKKEFRSFLMTHTFKKPKGLHRVENYYALIDYFFKQSKISGPSFLRLPAVDEPAKERYVIVNVNSEAISRRLPINKSAEIIHQVQQQLSQEFIVSTNNIAGKKPVIKLIGGANDVNHVEQVYEQLLDQSNVEILAGKTNLKQLIETIQQAWMVISTDSGPAHIASASGVPLVVIFGAGDERNTGPYHNPNAIVIRNGQLPCEPCVSNSCRLQKLPLCLEQLDIKKLSIAVDKLLKLSHA